jgi:hypothetical protein
VHIHWSRGDELLLLFKERGIYKDFKYSAPGHVTLIFYSIWGRSKNAVPEEPCLLWTEKSLHKTVTFLGQKMKNGCELHEKFCVKCGK